MRSLFQRLGVGDEIAAVDEKPPSLTGKANTASMGLEQGKAQLALESPEPPGQRRLAHEEPRGGPSDVSLLGDDGKGFQVFEIEHN